MEQEPLQEWRRSRIKRARGTDLEVLCQPGTAPILLWRPFQSESL